MMDKYTQRLIDEWKLHGKIIIAVDYDDTIKPWRTATQEECNNVIEVLKESQLVGAYITIFTCRNVTDEESRKEIIDYCESHGLRIDSINKNPFPLPYGNDGKPYANVYIDDRGSRDSSVLQLREAMYQTRAYQAGKRLDNPGSTEF